MDSITNDTEVPEDQLEEQALHLNVEEFVSQPKAKAKPQRKEPADSSPRIILMSRRTSFDIEPGRHCLSAYEVSKKVIHLLRHSQQLHREEDGAVHFWRIKENLQNQFPQSIHWFDVRWKVCFAAGGGAKRRFQYCTDDSGTIIYFRALQGHSGRNLIDLFIAGQCGSSKRILPTYLPRRMCFDKQYSFCLFIPGAKSTKILKRLT